MREPQPTPGKPKRQFPNCRPGKRAPQTGRGKTAGCRCSSRKCPTSGTGRSQSRERFFSRPYADKTLFHCPSTLCITSAVPRHKRCNYPCRLWVLPHDTHFNKHTHDLRLHLPRFRSGCQLLRLGSSPLRPLRLRTGPGPRARRDRRSRAGDAPARRTPQDHLPPPVPGSCLNAAR